MMHTYILIAGAHFENSDDMQAWEFDIKFDKKTGHIEKVAKGDNAPYQAYIDTHNKAADASRVALRRLIPAAEKAGWLASLANYSTNLLVPNSGAVMVWARPGYGSSLGRTLSALHELPVCSSARPVRAITRAPHA